VILEPVDHGPDTSLGETLFVGTVGGLDCWAVDGNDQSEIDQRPDLMDLMRLFAEVDESTWAAAGRAVQLVEWSRSHRFCGHCAQPTEDSPGERARRCPACGLKAFPRLAPAIIALVERDDGRALLARNANWPTSMYSCLAGFVEPGESAEAAARREIREEVGIEIGQLRYFSSQPWPFPHSLMLGFHASYRSGDIVCDGEEIADAAWFAPDDLPGIPGRISIARRLIDDWLSRA
jgi:NAD+ diphosphatase